LRLGTVKKLLALWDSSADWSLADISQKSMFSCDWELSGNFWCSGTAQKTGAWPTSAKNPCSRVPMFSSTGFRVHGNFHVPSQNKNREEQKQEPQRVKSVTMKREKQKRVQ